MEQQEIIRHIRLVSRMMDQINYGIVYVDREKRIQICNDKAKEFTGIMFDAPFSHDEGVISEGDIVIIADNSVGEDDGGLCSEDLQSLNIHDGGISQGDILLAVGVYRNAEIEPAYKYVHQHHLAMPVRLQENYLGFKICAEVDTERRITAITVNDVVHELEFFSSVGNIVVVDGKYGNIKFFQAKGYSVRNEDLANILRGQPFQSKGGTSYEIDVTGRPYLDFFDESPLTEKMFRALEGEPISVRNTIQEINKRPFICTILTAEEEETGRIFGVMLLIQAVDSLEALVEEKNRLIEQLEHVGNKETRRQDFHVPEEAVRSFVGNSSKAEETKYLAYKASQNRFNTLITGESGTGKSILARAIHRMGMPEAPFVEVNCNAIAPSLFESELFGYVGGAFTGARSEGKKGFFEEADGGTIFLDEIGDIPLTIQVKLLHVLQNKIIYKVGSSKPVKVDVRVIAATNQNLEEEVRRGTFRQDLYYRINVFQIQIPPLRERQSDLYLLINQILETTCRRYGLPPKKFSSDALKVMLAYNWPGNVRELENVVERAAMLCDSNIIYSEYLSVGNEDTPTSMKELLAREEARILESTLIRCNGDKNRAMKELGMSRSVFYDRLKQYGQE